MTNVSKANTVVLGGGVGRLEAAFSQIPLGLTGVRGRKLRDTDQRR